MGIYNISYNQLMTIFIIAQFLIFVNKVSRLPKLLTLATIISIGWKWLTVTDTLAYDSPVLILGLKHFIVQTPSFQINVLNLIYFFSYALVIAVAFYYIFSAISHSVKNVLWVFTKFLYCHLMTIFIREQNLIFLNKANKLLKWNPAPKFSHKH